MSRTAIIAGQGALPGAILAALEADGVEPVIAEMQGFPAVTGGRETIGFRIERLVPLLDHLAGLGVRDIAFAGAIRRPRLDPELIDPKTAALVPRLLGAIGKGDDAALREVIAIFEEWDFTVKGVADLAPGLVPGPGLLSGMPGEADRKDADRAAAILAGLGRLDIGQGAVVAQGLCLAVETLPGTDAMLRFVADHGAGLRPDPTGGRGVFYKAPKPGQDRRIDLPTIGPETVRGAIAAGLAGIAWQADGVIVLQREECAAIAEAADLFLWAREA